MSKNDESNESEIKPQSNFCEICQHRFLNEYNFMKHMWRHGDGDQELFHFYEPQRRQRRYRRQHFICNICEMIFSRESTLRRHLLSDHNSAQAQAFNCDLCGAGFGAVTSLLEHSLLEHKEPKKPIDNLMGLNKEAGVPDIRIISTRSVRENISEKSADENMEICIVDTRSIGNDLSESSSNIHTRFRKTYARGLSAKFNDKRVVKVSNLRAVKALSIKHAKTLRAQSLRISKASNTMSLSVEDILKPCFVNLGSKCTTDSNVRSFRLSNVTSLVSSSLSDFLKPCFVYLGPKKYGCDICHKTFLTLDNYELHLAIHDLSKLDGLTIGRLRKILPKPSEGVKNKAPDYLMKQKTSGTWKCVFCRKQYKSKDALQCHVRSYCGKDGAKRLYSNWMKHKKPEVMKLMAEARLNAAKSMEFENTKESTNPSPKKPQQLKKPEQLKPFTCSICGTGFLKEDTLRMHSLTHRNLKKITCTICFKEFSTITLLQKHYLLGHKEVDITSICSDWLNEDFDQYNGKIVIPKPPRSNSTTEDKNHTVGGGFASTLGGVTVQKIQTTKDNSTGNCINEAAKGSNEMAINNSTGGGQCEDVTKEKKIVRDKRGCDVAKANNERTGDPSKDVIKQETEATEDADMAEDSYSVDDNEVEDPTYQATDSSEDDISLSHKKGKNTYSRERRITRKSSTLRTASQETSSESEKTYACDLCSRTYGRKELLQSHKLKTHSKVKSFDCDSCSSSFKLEKSLRLHQLTHSDVKTFICFTCSAEFSSIPLLQKHCLMVHKGDIKAVTISNDKKQAFFRIVEPHKGTPRNEKIETVDGITIEYETAETSACLRNESSNSEASNPHGDNRVSFRGKISNTDHDYFPNAVVAEITCTPEIDMTRHSAEDAGETSNCDKSSAIHSKDNAEAKESCGFEKKGKEKLYDCKVCHRAFRHEWMLTDHAFLHSKEPHFVCDTCNKRFFMKEDLRKHQEYHNSTASDLKTQQKPHNNAIVNPGLAPPFGCGICNECFFSANELREHQKLHSIQESVFKTHQESNQVVDQVLEPLFGCSVCDKDFSSEGDLKDHLKQHKKLVMDTASGSLYCCDICNECFFVKRELMKHLEEHNNEIIDKAKDPRYRCDTCNECFVLKRDLRKHQKQHKNQKPQPKIQVANESKDPLFQCGICNESFFLLKDYSKHHRQHRIQDIKSKKEAGTAEITSSVRLDTDTDSLLVSLIEANPSNTNAEPTTIITNQTVEPTVASNTTTTGQTVEQAVLSDTTTNMVSVHSS